MPSAFFICKFFLMKQITMEYFHASFLGWNPLCFREFEMNILQILITQIYILPMSYSQNHNRFIFYIKYNSIIANAETKRPELRIC